MKVVFDTNTVVSALLFKDGRLGWLRSHWRNSEIIPLVSRDTADELIRVLAYPKFQLDKSEIEILLGEYLPYVESVDMSGRGRTPRCPDPNDQIFVDLAVRGDADVLVTGDKALLEMQLGIRIETPAAYKRRMSD